MYVHGHEESGDPPSCVCHANPTKRSQVMFAFASFLCEPTQARSTSLPSEANKHKDLPQRNIRPGYHRNKTYYKGIAIPGAPVHSIEAARHNVVRHDLTASVTAFIRSSVLFQRVTAWMMLGKWVSLCSVVSPWVVLLHNGSVGLCFTENGEVTYNGSIYHSNNGQ